MDGTPSQKMVGLSAASRADAAMAAATSVTLPPLKIPRRTTSAQRKAYLEKLYGDYEELQSQREEIAGRKRKINFDMYESNQQEIQKLIFAGLDTLGSELGDWDTYEKVEALVKRFAYGQSHKTSKEKEEMGAMQSRVNLLAQVVKEKKETEASLAQSLEAAQRELAGALKLLRLKENEVHTLISQNNVVKLQLRCAQRDYEAFRGYHSETESSGIREDMKYLIQANKTLEQENAELRRFLNAQDGGSSTASKHLALREGNAARPGELDDQIGGSTMLVEVEDDFAKCIEDSAYRRNLLLENIPISSAVVDATRKAEEYQRRLEAEITCAMEMLDRDALREDMKLREPVNGCEQRGLTRMENGTFVSYASYQTASELNEMMRDVPVGLSPRVATLTAVAPPRRGAPSQALEHSAKSRQPSPTTTSLQDVSIAPVKQQMPREQQDSLDESNPSARTRRKKSLARKSVTEARASPRNGAAIASTPPPTVKDKVSVSRSSEHVAAAPAATSATSTPNTTAAQTCLKSVILRCAELSRVNALRREALHVDWFRQQLEEVRNQVALLEAAAPRFSAGGVSLGTGGGVSSQQEINAEFNSSVNEVLHPTFNEVKTSECSSPTSVQILNQTSAPERLHSSEEESRLSIMGAEEDSDEAEGTAVKNKCVRSSRAVYSRSASGPLTSSTLAPPEARAATAGASLTPALPMGLGARQQSVPRLWRHAASEVSGACVLQSSREDKRSDSGTLRSSSSPTVGKAERDRTLLDVRSLGLHAARLRQETQKLGQDAVDFMSEMGVALSLLGTIFEQAQVRAQCASEEKEAEAANAIAQKALEEAAVARAAQVLEEQWGTQYPPDFYAATPTSLPDTATDEQWLVHELKSAADKLIRQALKSNNVFPDGGQKKVAGAIFDTSKPTLSPRHRLPVSRRGGGGSLRAYFEREILQPLRTLLNNFSGNGSGAYTPAAGESDGRPYGAESRGVDGSVEVHRTGPGTRNEQGASGRVPFAPSLPMHWFSIAGDLADDALPHAAKSGIAFGSKKRAPYRGPAAFLVPTSSWCTLPSDIQMIRPTVLRYDFGAAALKAQQRVHNEVKQTTAYIFSRQFDDFVRQYILPIVSKASEVSSGSPMEPSLRTAIRQLREDVRHRCKRGVRLLFERVATNIRTRRLVRHPVFHGNSFVAYIGVLYNRWRSELEEKREQMRTEQDFKHETLFSLLQLKIPSRFSYSRTPPQVKRMTRARRDGDECFYPHHPAQGSSSHFDRARFSNK